eukprot:m.58586 g.58586  ORF g.58586 m.58586 type:complete len:64 (-) comp22569_c3_seq1:84-275(-)
MSWWLGVFVALFLVSPNLVAWITHGTTDLLAASGYTLEQWKNHLDTEFQVLVNVRGDHSAVAA